MELADDALLQVQKRYLRCQRADNDPHIYYLASVRNTTSRERCGDPWSETVMFLLNCRYNAYEAMLRTKSNQAFVIRFVLLWYFVLGDEETHHWLCQTAGSPGLAKQSRPSSL